MKGLSQALCRNSSLHELLINTWSYFALHYHCIKCGPVRFALAQIGLMFQVENVLSLHPCRWLPLYQTIVTIERMSPEALSYKSLLYVDSILWVSSVFHFLFFNHKVLLNCKNEAKSRVFFSRKGVLHPRPVFGLFLHFSQKLQQIGNK